MEMVEMEDGTCSWEIMLSSLADTINMARTRDNSNSNKNDEFMLGSALSLYNTMATAVDGSGVRGAGHHTPAVEMVKHNQARKIII